MRDSQDLDINGHHDVLSVSGTPASDLLRTMLRQPPGTDILAHLLDLDSPELPLDSSQSCLLLEPEASPAQPDFVLNTVILGEECRLSECLLWQIQEDYYSGSGIKAWNGNIPSFVTSSVYIADAYAEMILAFVRDYLPNLNLDKPVYIVEMATGTGRFSYLLLRELVRKRQYFECLKGLQLRYIMTDFTEKNVNFWQAHEKFQPYIESGLLDFAVFRPEDDETMRLAISGETLCAENIHNPVIGIANYFFDSIRQDLFRVESDCLMEGLVTIERHLENALGESIDPDSPPLIDQVRQRVRYRELPDAGYYDDHKLNDVLDYYRQNIHHGSIIFPIGAFNVIRNLEKLSGNRLVLISSDKAYVLPEFLIGVEEHNFVTHSGAFSYMVNYHALARYFQNSGGRSFVTRGHNLSIQTVCFLGFETPDCQFEHLNYLYGEKIDRANAITSNCALLPEQREFTKIERLDHVLAYIRINLADPKIICLLAPVLLDLAPFVTDAQRMDLVRLLEESWENYYAFPGEVNLPFWSGQVYYYLDLYEESIVSLDRTMACFGPHEVLYFQKGQNFEKLDRWPEAVAMYELALEFNADFDQIQPALDAARAML